MSAVENMSRELDAEVAEKVMGHGYRTFPNGALPNVKHWFRKGDDRNYGAFLLPYYSTSIADAWLVVEEMRKRGYGCAIFYHWQLCETNPSCEFDWRDNNGNLRAIEESGGTVPEAICRAALEATND